MKRLIFTIFMAWAAISNADAEFQPHPIQGFTTVLTAPPLFASEVISEIISSIDLASSRQDALIFLAFGSEDGPSPQLQATIDQIRALGNKDSDYEIARLIIEATN